MNENTESIIVERMSNLTTNCERTHKTVDMRLRELHEAINGNGREGMRETLRSHTDQIAAVRANIDAMRDDLHTLLNSVSGLNVKFWKMAIVVTAVACTVGISADRIVKVLVP